MDAKLAEVLDRVYRRGGKVIIPSFALERAQEIVFALKALQRQGKMPPMPVYVDSPLTVKITDVPRCLSVLSLMCCTFAMMRYLTLSGVRPRSCR